jgi:hypothetical protein
MMPATCAPDLAAAFALAVGVLMAEQSLAWYLGRGDVMDCSSSITHCSNTDRRQFELAAGLGSTGVLAVFPTA